MKKKFFYLFLLTMLFTGQFLYSQKISITVFDPLPTIDFGTFVVANNLQGAPRIFSITINHTGSVKLKGYFSWEENPTIGYVEIYRFESTTFTGPKTIYNNEIGMGDIRIISDRSNRDPVDKNLAKGKPSGKYSLRFELYDASGVKLGEAMREMEFQNPAQIITITSPPDQSLQDGNNVPISWTGVLGASSYKIKLNNRTNSNQSLEEALNSGTPFLNNYDVGNQTNINLRELKRYFAREMSGGQEIVLCISAVIPGPGGGTELKSPITTFYLRPTNPGQFAAANASLLAIFQQFSGQIPAQLLNLFLSGQIQVNAFYREDGTMISLTEVIALLNALAANPGRIFSVMVP